MFHKIARFVKNIHFTILSWQSDFLQKRIEKNIGTANKNIIEGCTVDITQKVKEQREKIDSDIQDILKNLKSNPENIIEYLKSNNIEVHILPNAQHALFHIHEKEGFISERHGYRALIINVLIGNGFKFHTEPLIIFSKNPDIYNLIRAFYSWYSMKEGISGFDENSQKLLYKLRDENDENLISRLSLQQIESLRSAISADVHAIEFVTKFAKENAGAKKALNKIKDNGSANI